MKFKLTETALQDILRDHFNSKDLILVINKSLDYSRCYYEGDCPDTNIEITIVYQKEE